MEIKVAKRYAARRLANTALYNFLFKEGWQLEQYLQWISSGELCATVALAVDEYPVGVAIEALVTSSSFTSNSDYTALILEKRTFIRVCQIFVKPGHRRQGIGTQLIKALSDQHKKVDAGDEGSVEFWTSLQKQGVDLEIDDKEYTL